MCRVNGCRNTTTSARESQALSSLSAINADCRHIILKPSLSNCHVSYTDVKGNLPCPETVPFVLWSALRSQFNDSQLRALTYICCPPLPICTGKGGRNDHTSSLDSDCCASGLASRGVSPTPHPDQNSGFRIVLLQGPPGTGKTHTVLGIIAMLQAIGFPGDGSKKSGKKVLVRDGVVINSFSCYYLYDRSQWEHLWPPTRLYREGKIPPLRLRPPRLEYYFVRPPTRLWTR